MNHFFILGCPRSGTTMLQQALNRHSEIVVPPETKFFHLLYRQPRRVQERHRIRLGQDLQIDMPELGHQPQDVKWARSYFEELARRYLARLGRPDVFCFGEKPPEHTSHLNDIRGVFPEARIVYLYRDGRDVALSLSRVPWMRCSVYGGFAVWLYYYQGLRQALLDRAADVCFVRYEDLAQNPAEELQRIVGVLGLPYESQLAEGCGNTEGIPDRERLWKGNALEPISADRIGGWTRELSKSEIQDLEWFGRNALRSLGYDLATPAERPATGLLRLRMAFEVARCAWQLPVHVLWKELSGVLQRPGLHSWETDDHQHGGKSVLPARACGRI